MSYLKILYKKRKREIIEYICIIKRNRMMVIKILSKVKREKK